MRKIINTAVFIYLFLPGTLGAQIMSPQANAPQKQDSLRLAYEYEAKGQNEKAIKILQLLFSQDPLNLNYYRALRSNYLRMQRYDDLEKLIEKRIGLKNDLIPKVDKADLLYKRGQEKGALAEWNKILETHPRFIDAYTLVGQRLTENRLFDEAIDVYKRARTEMNNATLFLFQVADLHAARMDFRAATEENIKYLKSNPTQWSVVRIRILSYVKSDDTVEEIAAVLREERDNDLIAFQIHDILGAIYLRIRDYPAAFEHYVAVDSLAPTQKRTNIAQGNELFQFAETARSDGEYFYATRAYELIIEKHPRSPYLLKSEFALASTFKEQGLFEDAIARFEDLALRHKNSSEGYMALFELSSIWFNQFHNVEKSEDVLRQLLTEYPNIPQRYQAMLDLGDCKLVQNQLSEAARWYESATKMNSNIINPIAEQGLFKLGELAFFSGKIDTALSTLNSLISIAVPRNAPQRGHYINDALKLIVIITNNRSDEEALKSFAKAFLLRRQWQEEKALQELSALISKQKPEIADEALLIIGEIEFDRNNPKEALSAFNEIITHFPDSYLSDLALKKTAEVHELLLGNFNEAQKIYEKLLVTYPKSIYIEEIRKKIRELEGVS